MEGCGCLLALIAGAAICFGLYNLFGIWALVLAGGVVLLYGAISLMNE